MPRRVAPPTLPTCALVLVCVFAAAVEVIAGRPVDAPPAAGIPREARTLLPDDPPGLLTIGGRAGQDQSSATVDSITGLWTTPRRDAFLFLDSRYDFRDDSQVLSANGLAYRQQLPGREVIVGANVFWDAISSERGNDFNQLGVGVEVLTRWVDARFNYYLPEDEQFEVSRRMERGFSVGGGAFQPEEEFRLFSDQLRQSRRQLSGQLRELNALRRLQGLPPITFSETPDMNVRTRTRTFKRYEAALEGFDAELGFLIPGLDRYAEVRLFGGYFRYNNPFGRDFEGFRARLEARLLPGVIADAEYFEDPRLHGGHWSAGVRVSVPLSIFNVFTLRNPFEGAGDSFRPRRRDFSERMAEMIVRPSRRQTATSGERLANERLATR